MNYLPHEIYQKLYKRYLVKDLDRFYKGIRLPGLRVLDLCAGDGRLTKYALDHGAAYCKMVDNCPEMLEFSFAQDIRHVFEQENMEWFLSTARVRREEPYDVIVCRQAINYWFRNIDVANLAQLVKKNGSFIFNTFNTKPSGTPSSKSYTIDDVDYHEVSYFARGKVYHMQAATDMIPHLTSFDWISREEFTETLSSYFYTNEVVEGNSSMWYCTKMP